jgi:hypothetical protein
LEFEGEGGPAPGSLRRRRGQCLVRSDDIRIAGFGVKSIYKNFASNEDVNDRIKVIEI